MKLYKQGQRILTLQLISKRTFLLFIVKNYCIKIISINFALQLLERKCG